MTPTIGRIVTVRGISPAVNNGAPECPAIITRVWSESAPGQWTVNLRLIRDQVPDQCEWLTSRYLYDVEPNPRPEGMEYAVWPERV